MAASLFCTRYGTGSCHSSSSLGEKDGVHCFDLSRPEKLFQEPLDGEGGGPSLPTPTRVIRDSETPLRVAKISEEAIAVSHSVAPHAINLFHPDTGECTAKLTGGVSHPTYGLDGVTDNLLCSADHGSVGVIWDLRKKAVVHKLEPIDTYSVVVRCVREWESAIYVAGGGDTHDIKWYDPMKGAVLVSRMKGHKGYVNGISENLEKSVLYSVGADSTAKVWSKRLPCAEVGSFPTHDYQCSCCFAEDLNLLIMGTNKGGVEVWDVRHSTQSVETFSISGTYVFGGFARIDKRLFVGATNSNLCCFKLGSGTAKSRRIGVGNYHGAATVGAEFDRPRCESRVDDEVEEHLQYLIGQPEITARSIRPTSVSVLGSSKELFVHPSLLV